MLDAAKVASTVVLLALLAQQLDHWPTQKEYAQAFEVSERKAQMEWQLSGKRSPTSAARTASPEWLNNHARPKDQAAGSRRPCRRS